LQPFSTDHPIPVAFSTDQMLETILEETLTCPAAKLKARSRVFRSMSENEQPVALVVEDEMLLRLHAAGLLEEHGFAVAAEELNVPGHRRAVAQGVPAAGSPSSSPPTILNFLGGRDAAKRPMCVVLSF
jgi:hypothetical protein